MKKTKANSSELLFESICDVGQKYEISREKVLELFNDSMNKVLTKLYPERIFKIEGNVDTGKITCQTEYDVIEDENEDYDDFVQIHLSDAKKVNKNLKVGDKCLIDFDIYDPQNLSKQQIIQIMQIFKQRLNELNNIKVFKEWGPKVGTLIMADVDKFENRSNSYLIDLKDGNFGFLSRAESIPGENLKPGEKYQFLVKEVKEHSKGWPVLLSRADEQFVAKLLEENVPEIGMGEINIEVIKRIPGFKTKVAVKNNSVLNTFDPAAVVVGQKGSRIKNLSTQINNEKIEIVRYSDDLKTFLLNLCGNNIVGYKIMQSEDHADEKPHITLVVDEESLPVIIGKKGFNIKLIANMLNATVDIHTVEQAKTLNIDYDKVDPTIANASANTKNNSDKYNKPKTPSYTYKSTKPVINAKMSISNEELLDDIDNLSEDEIKKLFNIDISSTANNLNNSTTKKSQDFEKDLVDDLEDYEDSNLSDAFADEIANINIDDEKNK